MLLGQVHQLHLQRTDQQVDHVDSGAQPQPHVGRHLVVARAAGVQPFARFADQFRETLLDIEMHVLQVH
jgi:hypothetical protein